MGKELSINLRYYGTGNTSWVTVTLLFVLQIMIKLIWKQTIIQFLLFIVFMFHKHAIEHNSKDVQARPNKIVK